MPEDRRIPVVSSASRPFISLKTLDSFRDRFLVRDPRGQSARPAMQAGRRGGESGFFLGDGANLFITYRVRASQGRRFAEATGDENPIHREGNIVPGAMTVSKILLPLEVLFPTFRIERLRVQFKQPATYGETARAFFSWREVDGEVRVLTRVFQSSGLMARCQVSGSLAEEPAPKKAPLLKGAGLDRIRSYFHALRIDSRAFLEQGGRPNYVFPLAFIASLPSGEMVKSLSGHGGFLNSLCLDFGQSKRIPIGRKPEVLLEPSRLRSTFRKIVTRITEGLDTYCHGFALVHPPVTPDSASPPPADG
ncbi:MAG: hypothetical protein O7H41_11705 [Planctomycetota bacterium]|nr:hypothetical protein [Planctomycetota bacterium]